jgi:hypothetical protein
MTCTICSKVAYPAETIIFEQKPYHAECFKCTQCSKKMEGAHAASQYEGKIYDKMCFEREGFHLKQRQVKWVPKAETAGRASVSSKFGGGGTPCNSCGKTVYSGEAVSYEQKIYHAKCLKCSECSKECTVNDVNQFENVLYCKRCFEKGGFARKQLTSKSATGAGGEKKSTGASARFASLGGGGAKCHTCQKTVYPAETVQFEQRPYHSKCFKCLNCSKELTVAAAESKGPQVYCTKCFQELGLHRAKLTTKEDKTEASSPTAAGDAPAASAGDAPAESAAS